MSTGASSPATVSRTPVTAPSPPVPKANVPAPAQRVKAKGFGAGGPLKNILGARRQNVAQGTTRRDIRRSGR